VYTDIASGYSSSSDANEPPDVDPIKLVEKWKTELMTKLGLKENRIVIINGGGTEAGPNVEVWVVPPGVSIPQPVEEETEPEEPPSF
jgi:hypothetical protein